MNFLDRAASWLNTTLGNPAVAGTSVTYARGADCRPVADAVVGRTVFASNQMGAARVEWGDRDYLIPVASLSWLAGGPTVRDGEPDVGDTITEVVNGVEMVFRVLPPDTGEPAWRPSDEGRLTYRIHTKRVA